MSQTSFYRQFINCIYRDDQGIELDSVSLSRKLGFEEALAKARVTLSIPETSAIVLYTRTYLPADDTKGRLVRVCEDVWQWAVTEPSVCEMYMRIDAGSLNARPISTLSTTYTGLPSSRGSSSDVRGQSTRTNVSRSSATKRIGYQQRAAITKKVSQSLQVAELKSYGWVGDKPLHTSRRPGPPKNYSYTRKLRKREESLAGQKGGYVRDHDKVLQLLSLGYSCTQCRKNNRHCALSNSHRGSFKCDGCAADKSIPRCYLLPPTSSRKTRKNKPFKRRRTYMEMKRLIKNGYTCLRCQADHKVCIFTQTAPTAYRCDGCRARGYKAECIMVPPKGRGLPAAATDDKDGSDDAINANPGGGGPSGSYGVVPTPRRWSDVSEASHSRYGTPVNSPVDRFAPVYPPRGLADAIRAGETCLECKENERRCSITITGKGEPPYCDPCAQRGGSQRCVFMTEEETRSNVSQGMECDDNASHIVEDSEFERFE